MWEQTQLAGLIEDLSGLSTVVIAAACFVHLSAFLVLWLWWRRDLRTIASSLDDFTRGLRYRSVLDSTAHLSDQIEAFLADVSDVLGSPAQRSDRQLLFQRMRILDEKRKYLHSLTFETTYNICRTMIEAYPLAGVLGTILAIGAALQSNPDAAAATALNDIVARFGDAIWSTFAGLSAAIFLMFLNSVVETPFQRLAENRIHVRAMIAKAKHELSLSSTGDSV
jgi:biopolymer transport protein ExbB